jgi:DNA-binding transcriptional regulator GbsR (MarR family)
MTESEAAFVESMGSYLASFGMTPMAGRMWGWLLICDPVEQTAADLAEALQASRGAISGTARILTTAGMIRRTRRRGDRREFFSSPPDGFDSLLANAGQIYEQLRRILDSGLAVVADRPDNIRDRLQHAHDAVAYIERELPVVLENYARQRRNASSAAAATALPDPPKGPTGSS